MDHVVITQQRMQQLQISANDMTPAVRMTQDTADFATSMLSEPKHRVVRFLPWVVITGDFTRFLPAGKNTFGHGKNGKY